jgi:hypothetical protein
MLLTGSAAVALQVLERAPKSPSFAELHFWTDAFEFTRRFEEAIGFMRTHLARAISDKNAQAELDLSVKIAYFEAWWSGSHEPLRNQYERVKRNPLATPAMKSFMLLALQEYDGALKEMSSVETGSDPYASNSSVFMAFRAYALRNSGNRQLAQSYLKNSIATIEGDGMFLATMPGNAHATLALLHALAGNKEAAVAAAKKAESNLDASRNLPLYYLSNALLARAYFEAGEIDKGRDRLDLILSGQTGSSTGRVLVEFHDPALLQEPRFQAVIRKHADQLKDPAILDKYFTARR